MTRNIKGHDHDRLRRKSPISLSNRTVLNFNTHSQHRNQSKATTLACNTLRSAREEARPFPLTNTRVEGRGSSTEP
eukprot:3764834-Rhodomonas_salina.2